MADEPANPFVAGTANFRETTKWLVAGTVAVAAGVLAGSPLTALGSLGWGPRLAWAIGSATLAFLLLGVVLWRALDVVAADTVTVSKLARAKGAEAAVRRRIEARLKEGLPFGCETLDMLEQEGERRANDESDGAQARYDEFVAAMAQLNPALGFEYKRDRFLRMRRTTVLLMPLVILSIGVFAWATNPPADAKPLSVEPRFDVIALDAHAATRLSEALTPACFPRRGDGGTWIRVLVVAEFPAGRSDLIGLPVAPGCRAVRLIQQNGRVFTPN